MDKLESIKKRINQLRKNQEYGIFKNQLQAKFLSENESFKASRGWIKNFKKRHQIENLF